MLEPPPNSPTDSPTDSRSSSQSAEGASHGKSSIWDQITGASSKQSRSSTTGKATVKPSAFAADTPPEFNQPEFNQAEDSLLFRVLVQVLVFVSIGTVDIVASTNNSLWAIPLSAVGAGWGWYARRRRNILVKALIALAMIAMLMIFLTDLVTQSEETRLLLARLLIQLQVLHSFDLPRRKDLGYSIVIGVILMGMSASLSQTMIFAVLLVLFLALSLPVMVLDHRSRLRLPTQGFQLERLGIRPLPLLGFLGVVLALGLTIFALLPRLPGYQLRNFPVSTGMAVRREIPRGGIVARQQNGPGTGNNQSPGQQIGEIGTGGNGQGGGQQIEEVLPPLFAPEIDTSQTAPRPSKPELVMRVRSQAELFWRVMAYDEFTGKGWRVSRNNKDQIRTIRRSFWNYEFFLPYFAEQLIDPRHTQEVIQTYTLTTENFPNLVPAAATPYRLFFPSEEVDYDLEGTIRGPGPLPNNLTYTVISAVTRRDREGLIKTSQKYPRLLQRYYLSVPPQTAARLAVLARSWIDNAKNPASGKPLNLDNPYDISLFLAQELKQRYTIQNWSLESGQTSGQTNVVERFLDQKGGQEGQFVSTLVLMLRSLGIPTRYVVGFASGKFNPFTGFYEVYNTDAMSLAEVFFPGYGWMTFDPVPTRPLFPVSVEEDRTFSVLQTFWQWIASFLPAPLVGFVAAMFSNLGKALMAFFVWLNDLGAAGIIVGIAALFGIALGGWLLWQLWSSWREYRRLQRMHPVQRIYTQMLQRLREEGLPKAPHYTPFEYLRWLEEQLEPSTGLDKIRHITGVYQSWRYGAQEQFDLTALDGMVKSIRRLPKSSSQQTADGSGSTQTTQVTAERH
ncbi:MAG: DUF3488 and DUF4129 domain-containing transglutaminase family protein [Pseudanabaenaceae cyanobacterium]